MKNENNDITRLLRELLTDEEYETFQRALKHNATQGED